MQLKHGLNYYPQATDPYHDEKIYLLMELSEDAGLDGYIESLRWGHLLQITYGYGPALEVSALRARKIAHDMRMEVGQFEAFVSRCVESELLDRGLWERCRVVTSHAIQETWMAAKKRARADGLPAELRQWSLLDDGTTPAAPALHVKSGQSGQSRKNPDNPGGLSVKRTKGNGTKGKGREEDQTKVVLSGEEGGIVENPSPTVENPDAGVEGAMRTRAGACLSQEVGEDTQYVDDEDGLHRTPMGALAQIYAARTGRDDLAQFVGLASDLCPAGCRGDPEHERQCFALLERSLRGYDPERGSPWAKARVVLTQDRGW